MLRIKVELLALEEFLPGLAERLEVQHEVTLTFVLQHHGLDLDEVVADVDERLGRLDIERLAALLSMRFGL